ncbi:delta-12 fatty acid desaturase [Clavulina sp. PMI_390]|nr:delta-12 fatty acid desaturase [Clavulina sp. PMI_390]
MSVFGFQETCFRVTAPCAESPSSTPSKASVPPISHHRSSTPLAMFGIDNFDYIFDDAPDYKKRLTTPYTLPSATMKEIHESIPAWCHEQSTTAALYYTTRMLLVGGICYTYGLRIPYLTQFVIPYGPVATFFAKWALWINYWWWMSMVFGGFWTIAHDAGHMNLSPHRPLNNAIGWILHSFLLVPYYGWKYSHRLHHNAINSIERDEYFCPPTRSQFSSYLVEHSHPPLPPRTVSEPSKYAEILEEAPISALVRLGIQQFFGLQAYFLVNVSGNVRYPAGTNHLTLGSALFGPRASRAGIIASDIGLVLSFGLLGWYTYATSFANLWRMYGVPYFLVNHWIVGIVYLQHNDPTVPHFRNHAWTYLRGFSCTVDRPFLGWQGRFFFHNLGHDHTAHHVYSRMPFYNLPYATEAIKKVMGDHYCHDNTNFMRSLYRNFRMCQFIDDEGDVVFFRDSNGKQLREIDDSVWDELGKPVSATTPTSGEKVATGAEVADVE